MRGILGRMVREGFSKEVAFEQKPEEREGARHVEI